MMMTGVKCGKGKCTYTLQIKQCLCHDFYRKDKSRERKQINKQTCIDNHNKAWELTDNHRLNSRASLKKQVMRREGFGNVEVEKTMHVCFPC